MQILLTVPFVLASLLAPEVQAQGGAASAGAVSTLAPSDPASAPGQVSVNVRTFMYAGAPANRGWRSTHPPAPPASVAPPALPATIPPPAAGPIVVFAFPPALAASTPEKSDGWQAVVAAFVGQAWILALLGLIFLTAGGKALIGVVSSRFKSVSKFKGAGIELEFSEAGAKEITANVDETLKNYLAGAQLEYDRQARIQDVTKLMRPALEAICTLAGRSHAHDLRTTLYVEDVVYDGFLYQLVGYLIDGRGKGRRFSERFGIIGRAWRMERSILSLNALGTAPKPSSVPLPLPVPVPVPVPRPVSASTGQERVQAIEKLVQSWGMTLSEAERASQGVRKSYLCVILRLQRRKVGLLYVDAGPADVFKRLVDKTNTSLDEDSLFAIKALENIREVRALSKAVEAAMSKLREKGTHLRLHNQTDNGSAF